MTSVIVGGIAKGVGTGVVKILFKQYGGAIVEDKSAVISRQLADIQASIKSAEKNIIDTIKLELGKSKYEECVTNIEARVVALQRAADAKQDGNPQDWDGLVARFWDTRTDGGGLDNALLHIHKILMGTGGNDGLFWNYIHSLHKKLADDNPYTGINWYLAEVDKYLDAALSLQLSGLTIQVSMSSKSGTPARTMAIYEQAMWQQLEAQISRVFMCLHPTVQKMKKNYYTPIDWSRFWQLQVPEGRVLHSKDSDVEVWQMDPSANNSWRFVPFGNLDLVNVQLGADEQSSIRGIYVFDYTPYSPEHREFIRCASQQTSMDWIMSHSSWNGVVSIKRDESLPMKIAPREDDDGFLFRPPPYWPKELGKHWFWHCTFHFSSSCALYKPPPENNLWTTDTKGEGSVDRGYLFQDIIGYISPGPAPNFKPLRRWAKVSGAEEHHYISGQEDGEGVGNSGWIHQGVMGYSRDGGGDGTVTLWRFCNPEIGAYYCSTDSSKGKPGYILQGGVAEVYPAPKEGLVPFLQFCRA